MRRLTQSRRMPAASRPVFLVALLAVLVPAVLSVASVSPAAANGQGPEVEDAIRVRLAEGDGNGDFAAADAGRWLPALRRFYATRGHEPVWTEGGEPTERAMDILDVFRNAHRDGLERGAYLDALRGTPSRFAAPADAASFDVRLSDALVRYVVDLRTGRTNPAIVAPDLVAEPKTIDVDVVLDAAAHARDMRVFLASYTPVNPIYRNLKGSLAAYRRLGREGGWAPVPAGDTLRIGDTGARVKALRRRLDASADLFDAGGPPDVFEEGLRQTVVRFQKRHGLEPDGIVGRETLAALNVPVDARIRQIVLNMERWRWMPDDLGERHLFVNIADFSLQAVEGGLIRQKMRVVVGRLYRRTPAFSSTMTYLELNPYWHVPPKIAVQDLLPKFKADADLASEGYQVTDGWKAGAAELDPASIDWNALGPGNFPYKLRQDPGVKNALGRVKFMFPNRYSVYLHDTPSRELFQRTVRTFSSGCIRVERALDLAAFVLDGQKGWDTASIVAAARSGESWTLPLARPLPVYLTYLTAWTSEDGTIQFRNDIYGRDRTLAAALFGENS